MSNTVFGGAGGNVIGKGSEGNLGKERIHCNGLRVTGAVTAGQVVPGTVSKLTATGVSAAIPLGVNYVELTSTAAANALSLADGSEGQEMTIVYVAQAAGPDTIIVTPATLFGGTTLTFNALGDVALIRFSATGGWYVIAATAVLA